MGTPRKGPSRLDTVLGRCHESAECWLWQGAKDWDGYAIFSVNNKHVRGHRWVWEQFNGPIPEGLVLDHLCRAPACVNPWHLDPVTVQVNTQRGRVPEVAADNQRRHAATITHCPQGHLYSPENTRVRGGRRHCKECGRSRSREYWRRRNGWYAK